MFLSIESAKKMNFDVFWLILLLCSGEIQPKYGIISLVDIIKE